MDVVCISEYQVCDVLCVMCDFDKHKTMFCVTGIGRVKRILCDSMHLMYASLCWRRGQLDGLDVVCIHEYQVCDVCDV